MDIVDRSDDELSEAGNAAVEHSRELLAQLAEDLRTSSTDGCTLAVMDALLALSKLGDASGESGIDIPDADGETALSLAACQGHAGIVQALLEKGADAQHCPSCDTPIPMVCYCVLTYLSSVNLEIPICPRPS